MNKRTQKVSDFRPFLQKCNEKLENFCDMTTNKISA